MRNLIDSALVSMKRMFSIVGSLIIGLFANFIKSC